MNLNFLNPFSSDFLKASPEHSEMRAREAARNSYGKIEDTIDWSAFNNAYNGAYDDPAQPYDQNTIVFDQLFINKWQKISWYRSMAMYPLIGKALNIMTDEAVCPDILGNVAIFDIEEPYKSKFTATEFATLKMEFDYIINCVIGKEKIWDYYYKWLIDSELFLEICLNDAGDKVVGLNTLAPYAMLVIYDKDSDNINGFIENTNYLNQVQVQDKNNEIKRFLPNQIAYVRYPLTWNNRNDVRGHLERSIRPLNQLRNIEDALTVYRITRATEHRVFNIYTGRRPPDKAAAYVQEVRNKYRKNLTIDNATGMINAVKNTQAMTEDFFFAKDDSGNASSVETFASGSTFDGQLQDVWMFQKQVMDGMFIPQARWKSDEVGGANYNQGSDSANLEEVAFQRCCRRLRRKFADLIRQIFVTQLRVRGYKEKFLDAALYNIDLHPATDFERMRDLTLAEKRGSVLSMLSQFLPTTTNIKPGSEELAPLFSKQYFMEKILGLSTQDILLNNKMLEEEIKQMNEEAEAAAANNPEEGGDEGGDLGF
jgi:hypothetical protein